MGKIDCYLRFVAGYQRGAKLKDLSCGRIPAETFECAAESSSLCSIEPISMTTSLPLNLHISQTATAAVYSSTARTSVPAPYLTLPSIGGPTQGTCDGDKC